MICHWNQTATVIAMTTAKISQVMSVANETISVVRCLCFEWT